MTSGGGGYGSIEEVLTYQEEIGATVWPPEKTPFLTNPQYWEREALFMAFQPEDIDIVCLGDSITQKLGWQDVLPCWRVANRGIGSDTTAGMTARIDSVKALDPAVVSLMAGVNDLGDKSPEETAESYAVLLDTLAQELPDTSIIVTSVLPVATSHPLDNQNVRALNQDLAVLCQERGLRFLDLYEEFAGENGDLSPKYNLDGVHLTPEGYRLWLSHLVPALTEVLVDRG